MVELSPKVGDIVRYKGPPIHGFPNGRIYEGKISEITEEYDAATNKGWSGVPAGRYIIGFHFWKLEDIIEIIPPDPRVVALERLGRYSDFDIMLILRTLDEATNGTV